MKIVVAGNYGAGNLGDEMILKGLLHTLMAIVPYADVTVLSNNPEETSRKYFVRSAEKFPSGVRSLLKKICGKTTDTTRLLRECDYFILGGGGLFGSLKKRANIIWGIQAMMAYFYKKPVIMYGQSIGNLKGWFEKWIVRKLFKNAKLIIVRDKKSRDRLNELGIKKQIYVYPDLAFKLKVENPQTQGRNKLLVALRHMEGLTPFFKKSVAEFLNWIINEHKWQVTFVTFQKGVDSDDPLHEEVMEMIIDKPYIDLVSDHDIDKVMQSFLDAEMVLGMRLHSLISAIKTNTPFIAINYAPKVEDLLESSVLKRYLINVDEINAARLREQFGKVQAEKEYITEHLSKFNENTTKAHGEMEDLLRNYLV